MTKEIDAITKLYDFMIWMIPKIDKFPRNRKFVLGDRMENMMLDMLELLINAAYSRKKKPMLVQANLNLEKLRYMVRMTKDLKVLSVKGYEYCARTMDSIGVSIGGWLKYCKHENI